MRRIRRILYQSFLEAAPQPPQITVSGDFAIAGATSVAFSGTGITYVITFSESDVIVPYRRAMIYRSVFDVPAIPVNFVSGSLSISGSTTASFAGQGLIPYAEYIAVIPTRRKRSTVLYPNVFSPPATVPLTVSGTLSISGSSSVAYVGASTAEGVFSSTAATSIAFVGAATAEASLSVSGSTTAAFVSETPVAISFSQSDVIVPYRRAMIYRSVFETPQFSLTLSGSLSISGSTSAAFVGAAIGAGAFATIGSTTPNFVSNVILNVLYSESAFVLPIRRPRRVALYPSLYEPPLTVPLTISSVLATAGSTSVAFVGAATASGVLATTGATTIAFSGASTATGTFSTAGSSTPNFVSNVIVTALYSESPFVIPPKRRRRLPVYQELFSPPFIVPVTVSATLAVSGSSTAAFTGAAVGAGALAVSGSTTAAFIGRSTASGALSATGSTTAAFVGPNFQAGTLAVVGVTTLDARATAIVSAVFSTSGATTIAASGLEVKTVAAVLAIVGSSQINVSSTPIRKANPRRTRIRVEEFARPDTVFERRPATQFSRRPTSRD